MRLRFPVPPAQPAPCRRLAAKTHPTPSCHLAATERVHARTQLTDVPPGGGTACHAGLAGVPALIRRLAGWPSPTHSPALAATDASTRTAFLVIDTESVPDGRLLSSVKYAGGEPVGRGSRRAAQAEARESSWSRLRFPAGHISSSGGRVRTAGRGRLLAAIADVPRCAALPPARDRQQVLARPVASTRRSSSPSTAAAFDMPLLELAAFRYGILGPRPLPRQPRPLSRSDRPVRLAHQLRRLPHGRRAGPARESCSASRGRWKCPASRCTRCTATGSCRRSTITACATRSTRTSSSCARASSPAT